MNFKIQPSLLLSGAAALFAGGCADHVVPPVAVIATGASTAASADAGTCSAVTDVAAEIGQNPSVHAACSTDSSGHGLQYTWSLVDHPSGSSAAIGDVHLISPTFRPDVAGSYRLSLVVSDGVLSSAPAFVTVTAANCGGQSPVISSLVASANSVHTGTGVALTVTAMDPDAASPCTSGDTLSYAWHWVQVPAGSAAGLNGTTGTQASFVADVDGAYVAEVAVSDLAGHVVTQQISVTSDACGLGTPTAIASKMSPGAVAQCGAGTIAVNLNNQQQDIVLDGSASTDPDNGTACGLGQNLFYQWTLMSEPPQTAGGNNSGASLRTADGSSTLLRVRLNGEHKVRLIVSDSTGRRSQELMCVINVSGAP